MSYRESRIQFSPNNFWGVVDTVEDVLEEQVPTYNIDSQDRDGKILTSDREFYRITAEEPEAYRFGDTTLRHPYEMEFKIERTPIVEDLTVTHGMYASALYETLFGTRDEIIEDVLEEISERLNN